MAECLSEKRLRWFGQVQRRDKDEATRKIIQMTVGGKRNRSRPKLRWRDLVKEDMARNPMTTEMVSHLSHLSTSTLRSVSAWIMTCQCFRSSAISVVIWFLVAFFTHRNMRVSVVCNVPSSIHLTARFYSRLVHFVFQRCLYVPARPTRPFDQAIVTLLFT